ncbi:hypothetical protein GCM10010207_67060 [Streptomyces atratus]|nr:hypothetical protein GCM10010207_67060 [Streptomyces atratus]
MLRRENHSARNEAAPNSTAYTAHPHAGGDTTAAGTAIAAMPKPINASARAVLRPSPVSLRVRSRQYAPVTPHNAISSQPDIAGPCTAPLPPGRTTSVPPSRCPGPDRRTRRTEVHGERAEGVFTAAPCAPAGLVSRS